VRLAGHRHVAGEGDQGRAGRPVPLNRYIPPLEAKRWRYDFKVTFNKTMGPGIAETNAAGSATVTLGSEDGSVDGTSTYTEIQGDEVTLGGTRTITARQPFCGTPGLALTTATVVVSATPAS
jgi:hypothetical protein